MPRLDFVATLRDSVTPGLRSLSDTAEQLTDILGGVTVSGTGLTQALSSGLMSVSEGFEDLLSLVSRLAVISVLGSLVRGVFSGITAAISLSVQALTTLAQVAVALPGLIAAALQGVFTVFNLLTTVITTLASLLTDLGGAFTRVALTALTALQAVVGFVGRIVQRFPVIRQAAGLITGLAVGLDLLFNSARATGFVLGGLAEKLGEISANLLAQVIPDYLEGLAGPGLERLTAGLETLGQAIGLGRGSCAMWC